MPRDGSNVYHYPVGIEGEPNQTIESPSYNSFLSDIEQDLNAPRPILAGGTGANNAAEAMVNLGAEVAGQLVTNYDSFVFKAGSFYSAASATNAPTANAASGICYLADANNVVIEARDSSDGKLYVRRKVAGVWTAWALDTDLSGVNAAIAAIDASKVAKAGDTMTGNLTISKSASTLSLNKPSATSDMLVQGSTANIVRWNVCLGDSVAETGSNAGSNFSLNAFNDAGTYLFTPLYCPRATGLVQVIGNPTAALGIATKNSVETDIAAKAVRYDAAQTLNTTQKRQAASNQFQGVTMNYITGSVTYTTPAGVLWIEIELVGGGGGGAGSGPAPGAGAVGLPTTWGIGPILSSGAAGGGAAATGGTGGIPSGGGMNKTGAAGGNGSTVNTSPGGSGGNSPFGGAGAGGAAGAGVGIAAAANSGSGGGGGGVNTNPNGGGGGGAGGYVRHIINNPLASYPCVVGVGGGGGNGGAGGAAGGAGANGCIVVTEHYN